MTDADSASSAGLRPVVRPAPSGGLASDVVRWLCGLYLTLSGWTVPREWPDLDKAVAIVAPHTSNWDGPILLATAGYLRVKPKWLAKASLVDSPFGGLLRWLGCIPVDRSAGGDVIRTVSEAFQTHDRMILGLAPEGTRSLTPEWKSGFYRIAREAQLPVTLGYVDRTTKTTGLGPTIHLTGDVSADMDRIRAFYADKSGRKPEQRVEPRLREELEP